MLYTVQKTIVVSRALCVSTRLTTEGMRMRFAADRMAARTISLRSMCACNTSTNARTCHDMARWHEVKACFVCVGAKSFLCCCCSRLDKRWCTEGGVVVSTKINKKNKKQGNNSTQQVEYVIYMANIVQLTSYNCVHEKRTQHEKSPNRYKGAYYHRTPPSCVLNEQRSRTTAGSLRLFVNSVTGRVLETIVRITHSTPTVVTVDASQMMQIADSVGERANAKVILN